jgi:hypothetical protein
MASHACFMDSSHFDIFGEMQPKFPFPRLAVKVVVCASMFLERVAPGFFAEVIIADGMIVLIVRFAEMRTRS